MARPSKVDERRRELLPVIAEAFSDLGYRRATTAEIAARCGVQENILYRLWEDKKSMFLATIEFLFWRRVESWRSVLNEGRDRDAAIRLIELTADNLGEHGLYRVIFTALSETHDPDIKSALQRLYRRYHELVQELVRQRRDGDAAHFATDDAETAWALIALVTFMNLAVDLELMRPRRRKRLFSKLARVLLDEGLSE